MFRALSSAATGMSAQELRVSVISNNLANVNTTGFKKSRAEFQDLLYDKIVTSGNLTSDQTRAPVGIEIGQGVRTSGTVREFSLGDLRETGHNLDLAIDGDGLFQIQLPDGRMAYTRDGAFKMSPEGQLVNNDGYALEPSIVLPSLTNRLQISKDGTVSATTSGSTEVREVAKIQIVNFMNPSGLETMGGNLFLQSPASGEPIVTNAGQEGTGFILAGYVESSNVKVIEEMVNMISAQRAYETNSRIIKAADQMMRTTSQLK